MVLFVDGPLRGELREIDHAPIVHRLTPPDGPLSDPSGELIFQYTIHRYRLCTHTIRLGSIHGDVGSVSPEDIWDVIASVGARMAAEPEPPLDTYSARSQLITEDRPHP
jgi:hypothetical protein